MIKLFHKISNLLPLLIFPLLLVYSNKTMGKWDNIERQKHKITIIASRIPLEELFKKIKSQTGFSVYNDFLTTRLDEKQKISVNFSKKSISEVMSFILSDKKDLTFIIVGNRIIIIKDNLSNEKISPKIHSDTTSSLVNINGKVVDDNGNPIPGATVKIKTGNLGTVTSDDGTFLLRSIEKGTIIVASSIGFESRDFIASDQKTVVKLNPYVNLLDEKLIIAYGSTTKRLSTGNVGSVKANDIATQPVGSPLMAIQGRVPGIVIQQSSGLPGSGFTVRIQGQNSYSQGNDPLYVIDGVPYISQLLPTYNTISGNSGIGGVTGNPLNYINPSDIESIEILKDADATAIYGSRAANGAVLITTKKGRSGEIRTDIRLQAGWSEVAKKLDLLDTKEYLIMRHEALKNDHISTPSSFDFDLNGTWDTTKSIDWQKKLIGKSAQYTDAQISVSGGNPLVQYLVGVGYHKENTVFPGDFSDTKGSVHFNINSNSSNQKFKLQLTGTYLYNNNNLPRTDPTLAALNLAPVAPEPYNPDGSLNWAPNASGATTFFSNPLAPLNQSSNNKTNNLTSNIVLGYEIIPGMTIKSTFGYNNLENYEISKIPLSNLSPESAQFSTRSTVFISNKINSWIVEPQVTFNYKISKGKFDAFIGTSITQQNSSQSNIVAGGFSNDLIMEDLTSAPSYYGTSINAVYKYTAIYGRATYNWQDEYILNLNARRDGSSRFGSENQFHNFGSIGVAWIFSQQAFAQKVLPFLSFGKIRTSFGTTGNDQIGDYLFLDLYRTQSVSGPAYQNLLGLTPSQLTNPYLQWEETRKFQVGLELGLIRDKVIVTGNYNLNRSSNQLVNSPLPIITGFGSVVRNFPAVIQNTGWEFTVNSTNLKLKNFIWTSSFNLTIPKNQLKSYYGVDKSTSLYIGKPISTLLLFHSAGVNDSTGVYQFTDSKGNLTTAPLDPDDRIIILNQDPKFYGGFQNNFSYKGFSLGIFFQFTKQIALDNISYGISTYPGFFYSGRGNQVSAVMNRWQKIGDNATHASFSTRSRQNQLQVLNSDAAWVDASYIRLKNISISWQIPDLWKKAMRINNLRFFANAQNLLTFTRYKGLDPESKSTGLPPLRTISVGAQVTF